MRGVKPLAVFMLLLLILAAGRSHAAIGMRISSIDDFALPDWHLDDGDITASMDICIYALNVIPLAHYSITITGGSGFNLAGPGGSIPYELRWEDSGAGQLGSEPGTLLSSGVALGNQANGELLLSDCSLSGPNARLYIRVTSAAMTAALAGSYTDTITLLLSSP